MTGNNLGSTIRTGFSCRISVARNQTAVKPVFWLLLLSLRGHSIRRSRSIGGIHTPYNGNNADGFRASYSRKEGTRLSVSLLGEPQLPLL